MIESTRISSTIFSLVSNTRIHVIAVDLNGVSVYNNAVKINLI